MKYSPIYSCMAGLTLIQLFSDLNNKDHTKLRNCDVNFIHPKFVFKHLDEKKEFNWKKLEIKRPITLKEFLEMFPGCKKIYINSRKQKTSFLWCVISS